MSLWSILQRAAERWPDQLAVLDAESELTYRDVTQRATALASGLAGEGVGRGDRVAIVAPNGALFFEAYFAAARLGAVLVPVNDRLAAGEMARVLENAEPVLAIFDGPAEEQAREAASQVPSLQVVASRAPEASTPHASRALSIERLYSSSEDSCAPAEVGSEDLAQLYYTSGTTGDPKGVMLTHGNVHQHALAATSELDLAEDDVWGHMAPMFHLADAWATFAVTLVGGRHVMCPRFEAAQALELMARTQVTITNVVPTMLQRMLREAMSGHFDSSLRMLLSGGAAIAPQTVRRVVDCFGCEYVQTYGMTETSPYLTLSRLRQEHYALSREEQLRIAARTGRPFETIELEVVDERGERVSANDESVGEIRVRGVTVSPGYWRAPQATAEVFRDGWLYTGDLAVIDSQGYVSIVDRKKDLIITGGENVSPLEVENVLYEHPAVLEAAAYGCPHPEWGEEVRAAVVLAGEATEQELLEFCRERLASFKLPKRVELLTSLPKTGTGKIRKGELRRTACAKSR